MEAFQVVSAAGGTVFAPSNSAFDAFVEKWKSPSLDISKFSDLPQQTQEQILEYHLAPTAWKPKLLCYQQIAAIGQDDQNITMVWDNRYLPMGPDNTVGSFQATARLSDKHKYEDKTKSCYGYCVDILFCNWSQYDIDDMTFTVSDDYTGYKADFFAQSMLSSGSTVAYPIESILIPNVALQTLEGGGAGTDASDELDVVAEGPAQYQPQILEIL